MQAPEALLAGVAQVQVGEELPHGDGGITHPGDLDPAEPAHEARGGDAGNAVGEQEVDVFVHEDFQQLCMHAHDEAGVLEEKR